MNSPLLLDIMKDGRFYKQLKYTKRGIPEEIDGKILETFDDFEIKNFVEESLPSLKGKNYRIRFSDGKISST